MAIASPRPYQAIFISLLGNSFEWYDFMVYAALAPILAQVFFPAQEGVAALLETYGTFAAGFVTRPFGALLFGYLGDHFGRRSALLTAIGLMTLPTFLIGCLPTYAAAGLLAPSLLVVLRMLQGLAMSGEMPGCVTFTTEMAPPSRQTTITSLAIVASLSGMLLGTNGVWALHSHFGELALQDGLWRLPFLAAGVLGFIVYQLRKNLPESSAFLRQTKIDSQPVRTCLRRHWRAVLQGIGCYAAHGVGFYFLMVFSLTYFYKLCHVSLHTALLCNILLQLAMVLLLPIGGYLADRYGRRTVGLVCLGLMLAGSYSGLVFLSHVQQIADARTVLGLVAITAVFAGYSATLPAGTALLFPTHVRYTGVALLNNISMTIFGGLSPIAITFLIDSCHSLTIPAWPLVLASALSFASFWRLPKQPA